MELLTCIAGSNSAVERAFSLLTLLLSDRRLSMSHTTMEDLMLIKGNDKVWSTGERNEILFRAVQIYMEKQQKTRLDIAENETQEASCSKKNRLEPTVVDVDSSNSSDSDSWSEFELDIDELQK